MNKIFSFPFFPDLNSFVFALFKVYNSIASSASCGGLRNLLSTNVNCDYSEALVEKIFCHLYNNKSEKYLQFQKMAGLKGM